jgi:hypothetical protein
MKMNERRAFITLVLISIFLSMMTFLGGIRAINANNHKFCQIIDSAVAIPVPKPAHPKQDPSREKIYEGYLRAVKLGRDLGCLH